MEPDLSPSSTATSSLAGHWFASPPPGSLMEKAMAPHSSSLAWRIPWMEEPGGLQSMGSLEVGHNWATSLSLFPFMHWRRKWQPTPVFLPEETQGGGSLVGCRLWGRHDWSDLAVAAAVPDEGSILPSLYKNTIIKVQNDHLLVVSKLFIEHHYLPGML